MKFLNVNKTTVVNLKHIVSIELSFGEQVVNEDDDTPRYSHDYRDRSGKHYKNKRYLAVIYTVNNQRFENGDVGEERFYFELIESLIKKLVR